MSCSRKVREAARRYWLLGYSDEKIVPLLSSDFPDEKTPTRWHTIADWRQADDWEADLSIIVTKATEKRQEELATELAAMNTRQLALLSLVDTHTQLLLTARVVRGADSKPSDTELSPGEIAQLASALDRSIKNQRLIRGVSTEHIDMNFSQIDVKELSDEQLERIANGENPRLVLGISGKRRA